MDFLRNILSTIIGFFIALGILFIVVIAIGAIAATTMGVAEKISLQSNSVLELDLSTSIKDYVPKDNDPFAMAVGLADEKLSLHNILNAIENAKRDSNIKGISIKTTVVNAGICLLYTSPSPRDA